MGLDAGVRANWFAFTKPLEGYVPWPYLDDHKDSNGEPAPLVTIGYGCLVEPLSVALAAGVPRDVWEAVKAMPGGLAASHYRQGWEMSEEGINALGYRRLDGDVAFIERYFPAFDSWQPAAQQGACSMAWAMGAGFVSGYPRFVAAARDQDWAECSRQCWIQTRNNPGIVPRNAANINLFRVAAGLEPLTGSALQTAAK